MEGPEISDELAPRELTANEVAEAAGVTPDAIRGLAYDSTGEREQGKKLPGKKANGRWFLEFEPVKAYVATNRGTKEKVPLHEILRRPQGRTRRRSSSRDTEIAELKALLETAEAKIQSWQDAWAEQRRIAVDHRRAADQARSQAMHHLAGLLASMQTADDNRLGEIYVLEDGLAERLMPEGPGSL